MSISQSLGSSGLALLLICVPAACSDAITPAPVPTTATQVGWQAVYFKPHEFASKGNGAMGVQPRLVAALDATRAAFGRPIRILSGYRDPAHNRRIGGAPKSRHVVGDAVDIDLSRYDNWARYALVWHLIDNGFTSFGTYGDRPNMLHADMRPRAAIWRHGGGRHPDWLRRALAEWRWEPIGGSPFR